MPEDQADRADGRKPQTTGAVSRRRWLQLTGIAAATGLLTTANVSAETSTLPNTIIIDGTDTEGTSEYEFEVTGQVEPHPETGGEDPDGSTVEGSVDDDRDGYKFSGRIADLDVSGTAAVTFEYGDEGSEASRLEVVGPDDETIRYGLKTTGEIIPVDGNLDLEETDDDEWIARSSVGDGDSDQLEFEGEPIAFEPKEDVVLYLDDEQITPYELIDEDEPRGSSTDEKTPIGGGEGYEDIVTEDDADEVVSTREDLESALQSAGNGEVVFIESEAEINMNNTTLEIGPGVTLASDRGHDDSDGAVFYTERGSEPGELFTMQEDSRITGLQLSGPWPGGENGDTESNATTVLASDVEVDNCEIGQFSYAGVNLNNGEAHVHHNAIYENNRGGLGYGVTMGDGQPVIEYNYFDFNRHSVASTGEHTGYICRYNHFGPESTDGVIDIHSPAGVESEVHNNIIEATVSTSGHHDPLQAIQIRGTPDEEYAVYENWFWNSVEPRDTPSGWTNEAVIQAKANSWESVEIDDNYYGEDADVTYSDIIPGYDGHWS